MLRTLPAPYWSTFSVLVLFTDGDEIWKPFDFELSNTVHFERFVAAHPELEPLLNPASEYEKFRKAYIVLHPVDPAVYSYGRNYSVTFYHGDAAVFSSP